MTETINHAERIIDGRSVVVTVLPPGEAQGSYFDGSQFDYHKNDPRLKSKKRLEKLQGFFKEGI